MNRPAPVRRTHSGFTLLELLVVLVLAHHGDRGGRQRAVVHGPRARYHQTVRDVANLLVQARTLSEREGRARHRLHLRTGGAASLLPMGNGATRVPGVAAGAMDRHPKAQGATPVKVSPCSSSTTTAARKAATLGVLRCRGKGCNTGSKLAAGAA